ncbi:MAG: FAD-dependent oxidoreductase, partial [Clostridia bacterium]|nr:FAD-dependent oxidoreductase [Clostridia bacterium]
MKKIAIIGGGVAGLTASIYALRANAEVTLFEQFGLGGYTANLTEIHNYPSYTKIEGWELASNISKQAKALGLKDVVRQHVQELTMQSDGTFNVVTAKQTYNFTAVIVATGTTRNKLGIEEAYVGKGVSYCATCDGNFYKGQDVVVVGSNGHAVSEALYLADLCNTVYMLAPNNALSLSERKQAKLDAKTNIKITYNAKVTEILGDGKVEGVKYVVDDAEQTLSV